MAEIKVFISSVQSEFAKERKLLCEYIRTDALLGKFFRPFIFEELPAINLSAQEAYLTEVAKCDIYLGLFGETYGNEDVEGISPTEREFNAATEHNRYRMIFIKSLGQRQPKEQSLISKAEQCVIRKTFSNFDELRNAVYTSLIHYMSEKELIHIYPFDATPNSRAKMDDLDLNKIRKFISLAHEKRGYKLTLEHDGLDVILNSMDLLTDDGRLTNAAILLFGKNPQHFFRPSEIKCAQFYGKDVQKPAPFYQIYEGTVFEMCDQAKTFVMSHIDARIGNHTSSDDGVTYELPENAVHEAIMNAIIHRDYTSNGSVQVMLFRDRLEVWNPGQLPPSLSVAKLRVKHKSLPANPILAYPAYLAGYIEKLGTGTKDLVEDCIAMGLPAPQFVQEEEDFSTIIYRPVKENVMVNVLEIKYNELTERQQLILRRMSQNSTKDVMVNVMVNVMENAYTLKEFFGVSERTIRRDLKILQEEGFLRHEGADKDGRWQILYS